MGQLDMGRLCQELEAQVPSPAGGSAAAAVGAIGASLVVMVGQGSPDWPQGAATATSAIAVRERLLTLGREDADAVEGLLASRGVAGEDERTRAILRAAEVPLEIAERAADVVALAGLAAAHGKPAMRPDAAAARELAGVAACVAVSIVSGNVAARDFPSAEVERLEQASRLVSARIAQEGRELTGRPRGRGL